MLAAALVVAGLLAPTSANAAVSATITGDDGQPVPMTVGAPPTLRNMDVSVSPALAQGDAVSWRYVVTDATGTAITSDLCWSSPTPKTVSVPYRGNTTYALTVTLFNAASCAGAPKAAPTVYTWNVAASVAIGQPAGPLPTRPAGSLNSHIHLLDFAGNPGTSSYEIQYAKGGVIGPDGAISGPSKPTYLDVSGKVRFPSFDGPGTYVVVARAQKGSYYSPWSAPVTVTLQAPFDLSSVSFPDSRGPSYQLRGIVREKAIAGSRVTVAAAKGKKGKRFRTLGKGKVNSQGVFKVRFRLSRGTYRLRYSFSGNSVVSKGTAYQVVKIRRVLR